MIDQHGTSTIDAGDSENLDFAQHGLSGLGAFMLMTTGSDAPVVAALPARAKPEKEWLCRKEAAIYLTRKGRPISPGWLAVLASNNNAGKGPSFTRQGWKVVQYHRDDLDAWLKRDAVRVP